MTRKLHLVYPGVYDETVFAFSDKLKEAETGGYHHAPVYESAGLRTRIPLSSSASYLRCTLLFTSSFPCRVTSINGIFSFTGWQTVKAMEFVQTVVAYASNRVFVGLPLCRSHTFLVCHPKSIPFKPGITSLSHPLLIDRVFTLSFCSSLPFLFK